MTGPVFPPNPSVGTIVTYGSRSWFFNGTSWDAYIAEISAKRFDYVSNVAYIGIAPFGSANDSAVWKIRKMVVASNGDATVTTAFPVKWDDRLTATYS